MKKMKLALIGDDTILQYTAAERLRLWELLGAVSNAPITYDVIPLATQRQVREFFHAFQREQTYHGFNIAIPWRGVLAKDVDELEPLCKLPQVNTIYRDAGRIIGTNTDALAAQKAVEYSSNLYKCNTALVLSADGSGLPLAYHLKETLGITTYVYDTGREMVDGPLTICTNLYDVAKRTYDLVVNTTHLGSYHSDRGVAAFTSPLSLELLEAVTHADSIVQETNYLPIHTLFIQLARSLDRSVVTGELILCFRGNESLKRFCGLAIDERTLGIVIEEMRSFVAEREVAVLKLNPSEA